MKVKPLRATKSLQKLALSLSALACAGLFAAPDAEAQMSPMSLKFQSDNYQVLNRAETSGGFEISYLPKDETAADWTHMLIVTKHASKSMKDLAVTQAREIDRRKGSDRYSGALLMESKSKLSIFLDSVKSEDKYVECAITRFFETKEGVYSYRLIRRMYRNRLPANASMANLEVMKFISRARLKRSDLIIDFARKLLPYQSPDDPMGMTQLPFLEKKVPAPH